MFYFYTSWKRQKNMFSDFFMGYRMIEMGHVTYVKKGYFKLSNNKNNQKLIYQISKIWTRNQDIPGFYSVFQFYSIFTTKTGQY